MPDFWYGRGSGWAKPFRSTARARNSYEPGWSPSTRTENGTVLNGSGQSLGLPLLGSKPQSSFGEVPAGRMASQSSGGDISSQGRHAAVFQAGSSSARASPVPGRTQYSTRLRPDQPAMAIPSMTTGFPALNDGDPLPR